MIVKMTALIATFLLSLTAYSFQQGSIIPREFIVKLKRGSESQVFNNSRVRSIIKKIKRVPNRYSSVFRVRVDASTTPSSVQSLKQHPAIEYIEPNRAYQLNAPQAIQKISQSIDLTQKQWALENDSDTSMNTYDAWRISTGSEKVTVAVIDTGVDFNHEDLKDNMWVNLAEKNGKPGVDDDQNGFVDDVYGYDNFNFDNNPMDDNGHGTHCAGVIGASHNGLGISGINSRVKIMAVKAFDSTGRGSTASIINSIYYAVDNGAHVLNNSYGAIHSLQRSMAYKEAISYALERNVVFVAAAGNNNADTDSIKYLPANIDLPNVISVAAYDIKGNKAIFSNYGKKTVHVAAPGVDIISTVPGGYAKMSGTSMAAPHVTGLVALLLSINSNWLNTINEKKLVDIDPIKVRNLLISSSIKSSKLKDVSISDGRVDASQAARMVIGSNRY